MTTDPKLVEAGAQAIELCSLWTPRRLADAVLTAVIPLIRKAALQEAAKVDQRLWWFLHILAAMGGSSSANDSGEWVDAFCDDRDDGTDTFNRAAAEKLTRVTHDTSFDSSTVHITEAGREYLALLPAPQKQEGGGD